MPGVLVIIMKNNFVLLFCIKMIFNKNNLCCKFCLVGKSWATFPDDMTRDIISGLGFQFYSLSLYTV